MAQDSVSVDRWKYIGGSDIPIIMNISSFKTRWDLLLEKAQITEDEFRGNKYTEYGNMMEPIIRNYISSELSLEFEEGKHYLSFGNNGDMVRIHTDGENEDTHTILEIKTTSQVHEDLEEYKHYLVQLLFYMMMRNFENGILAVYKRPDDFTLEFDKSRLQLFPVVLSEWDALIKDIKNSIVHFLEDLDKVRSNPFTTQEDLLPEDIEALASRLVEIKEQEEKFKDVLAEKKLIEEKLADAMTSNDSKTMDAFGWKMTVVPGKAGEKKIVEEFDQERFKEEHPIVFRRYSKEVEKTVNSKKTSIRMTRLSNEN